MFTRLRNPLMAFLTICLCCCVMQAQAPTKALKQKPTKPNKNKFILQSPTFKAGATMLSRQVFNGFGCSGDNVSPALKWTNAPAGTQSFALMMYDPDAPTGSGWWHWVVFNIPNTTQEIPEGAGNQPEVLAGTHAVQSMTDFGKPGYGGPCPPVGDKPHRYILTVYALKVSSLPLGPQSPGAMVGYYIHQNTIGTATLTGYYGR